MDEFYTKLGIDIEDEEMVKKFKTRIQGHWYEIQRKLNKSTAKKPSTVSEILRSSVTRTTKTRRRILSSKKTPTSSGNVKRQQRTIASPQATTAADNTTPKSILQRKTARR
jgi:hypothetical protein